VVQGNTVKGVMDAAAKTVDSIYEEAYKSEDSKGKPVVKTRRKARLKKLKAINREREKKQQEQVDFITNLEDLKIVIFKPIREGPRRDPRLIYPKNTDLDSLYTLFLLF